MTNNDQNNDQNNERSLLDSNNNVDHASWTTGLQQKNLKILVVDDEPVNRMIISALVKNSGATSHQAENGKIAVDFCKNSPVDLVLMDLNMPVMNGFDATLAIKKIAGDKFIPIIIITTYDDNTILAKAQAYGADDFMVKPISPDVLLSKINAMIRLKNLYDREKELITDLEQKIRERDIANSRLMGFQKELQGLVEKKTNELRQKDLKLLEMDRISGIYSFAAGMAHEINNPLGFVKASIDLLKKMVTRIDSLPKNSMEKADRLFTRIDQGIKRIRHLINILIQISNVNKSQCLPVNINKSITEATQLFKTDSKENVFEITLNNNVPNIRCNATEIHLCLINVISNALDAIRNIDDAQIHISTEFDKQENKIIIRVKDNGTGMSDDVLRRAFDPFFTTKPVGKGTGVGLTLTEGIVKRHGGNISLKSEVKGGTLVEIILPL